MRIAAILVVTCSSALIALPAPAQAQAHLTIEFGARLGPEIGVFAYSPARHGDWRTNYRRWTPVTLYDVNGHYYRNPVRGARPVMVYSYNNEFFFPPQDRAWVNFDRRFNYRYQPVAADYGRAVAYTPDAVVFDTRLGPEIGVFAYTPELAGDWHVNFRRWTPVTVFEYHGRYFPHSIAGARAVTIYRYRDEYFLPPRDQAWVGFDKRFDYAHRPGDADYARARPRP